MSNTKTKGKTFIVMSQFEPANVPAELKKRTLVIIVSYSETGIVDERYKQIMGSTNGDCSEKLKEQLDDFIYMKEIFSKRIDTNLYFQVTIDKLMEIFKEYNFKLAKF